MSIKGDLDRAKGALTQQLKDLEKDFEARKKALEDRIKDLEVAEKLVTPEIEAIVTKLGLVLGK